MRIPESDKINNSEAPKFEKKVKISGYEYSGLVRSGFPDSSVLSSVEDSSKEKGLITHTLLVRQICKIF